jgi:hypothetical protein
MPPVRRIGVSGGTGDGDVKNVVWRRTMCPAPTFAIDPVWALVIG